MNFAGPINADLQNDSPVSLGRDGFSFGSKPGFVQHNPSDAHVVVPDAHLLFSGSYVRIGNDLIISGSDQKFVVGNYFKGEARPVLTSKDGATLSGQIIDALTGHVVFAQAAAPASAAQVIGHILKLTGSASVIRNGVSIELHIGDAVQKGDVVQTGSDSSIGLTFIDGSAFGMTSNARMVLNEMIYDPNGSSNSSLISLVQGTITFVAGQTAKNGNMRVETPVATMGIRGTAVLVEISANDGPTKFSVLVEPDGHTGSYNLYDKATGQLIGTVSQAGQVTFVSSMGIGQAPTAVEQLKTLADQQNEKAIIQQVFQLYFPNYTPDDAKPNSPKSNPRTDIGVPENNIGKYAFDPATGRLTYTLITPVINPDTHQTTNTQVTFYNVKAAFSTTDLFGQEGSPGDASTNGALKLTDAVHIDDPDIGAAPFFDVARPFVANSGVLTGVTTTATLTAAAKAALHLDSLITIDQTTGDLSFNRADFNFLAVGEKAEYIFRVTASSGPDSASLLIKVTITGENDAPTIETLSTTATGGVTEDNVPITDNLVTSGAIGFQDLDLTDAHTATFVLKSAVSSAHLPGFTDGVVHFDTEGHVDNGVTGIGSLSLDAVSEILDDATNTGQVGWHFKLPDNDPVLQSLAVGQTIKQVYTITITDSSGVSVSKDIEITITGTNDTPTITAGDVAQSDTIFEIPQHTGDTTSYDHNASGTTPAGSIHFADVDLIDRPTAATYSQVVTYKSASGATLSLTAAQILSIKQAFAIDQNGNTNNGVVDWTYELRDNVLDFMSQNEKITLVSTVRVSDGNGGYADATVTINIIGGANDAPEITSVTTLVLTESALTLHDTIAVNFTDVDLNETGHTALVKSVAMTGEVPPGTTASQVFMSGAFFGLLSTAAVVKNAGDDHGSATFNFDADSTVFDYLAVGEVVTLTYTVKVTDSNSASDTHTVTVTVTGTNDAPVIDAIAATALNEQTDTSALTLASPIHVTFSDVDLNDIGHSASITAVAKLGVTTGLTLDDAALKALVTPGVVAKAAGSSSGSVDLGFSADSTAFDYLAAGEQLTLTYTVTINDGDGGITPKTFDITITGTNDKPLIGAATLAGAVTEDATAPAQTGSEIATGMIAFSDVDLTDGHLVSAAFKSTDYSGQLGTLTAVKTNDTSNGAGGLITWTFTATDAAMNGLAQGQVVHETYTVTLDDGHGGIVNQDIIVTINGANDAPTVAAALTGSASEGDAATTFDLLAGATDVDNGETLTLAVVASSVLYTVNDAVATGTSLGLSLTGSTLHLDPTNPAFDHLAAGQTQEIIVSYDVEDVHHAITHQIETITVTGTNDAPVVSGAVTAAIVEGGAANHLDALANASDADDGHVLSVVNVPTSLPAGVTYDAVHHTFTLDPGNPAYQHLGDGQSAVVTVDYGVSDGIAPTPTNASVSWTINGTNDAPVMNADNVTTAELGDGVTKVQGVTLSDVDAGADTFTVKAVADHGTVSTEDGQLLTNGISGNFAAISDIFSHGAVYTPQNISPTDKVTLTVTDGQGASDTVNFIFKQFAPAGVTLEGTAGKDWILSSTGDDTMTGLAGPDNFVFAPSSGHDTITDFSAGSDKIDFRGLTGVDTVALADLLSSATHPVAGDTLLHLNGTTDTLLVKGVAALNVSDFILHA